MLTMVITQMRQTERRVPPHTSKTRYTTKMSRRECQMEKPADTN
jgi:hypothetical protein